jgi:hypothetical protein
MIIAVPQTIESINKVVISPENHLMRQTTKQFVKDVRAKAREHGVKVRFGKGKRVALGPKRFCGGYFDSQNLVVATGIPETWWLRTLAHESCHMDQWIEKSYYWDIATQEDFEILEDYLLGKTQKGVEKAVNHTVICEADCEIRTIEKIKAYDLPLDVTRCTQEANSYLFFHKAMYTYGKWYSTAPYKIPSIVDQMPKKFYKPEEYTMRKNLFDVDIFLPCFEKVL